MVLSGRVLKKGRGIDPEGVGSDGSLDVEGRDAASCFCNADLEIMGSSNGGSNTGLDDD
jgi:hypothetical protein